jgi:hypothetical protein
MILWDTQSMMKFRSLFIRRRRAHESDSLISQQLLQMQSIDLSILRVLTLFKCLPSQRELLKVG